MRRNENGFTIIETTLVLAIASLILLIGVLAYQELNRTRRDAKRKNDVARMMQKLEEYAAANNGRYPLQGRGSFEDIRGTEDQFNTDLSTAGRSDEGHARCNDGWNCYSGVDEPFDPEKFGDYLNDQTYKEPTTGCSYGRQFCDIKYDESPFDRPYRQLDIDLAGPGWFHYGLGKVCDGENDLRATNNSRHVAIIMNLERGKFCLDNVTQ